ncbi:MAG TPA: PAS domain S-box protein [Chloroflexi bacterium]|nr:PAS domain S-box protein [Chloroflexota bacterium]
MTWSMTPVSYIYIQTALIAAAVALFAWRRRKTPGAASLTGLLAAAALWASMEAVENAAPTLEVKIMASKISHLGIQSLPVFFLLFTLQYTAAPTGRIQAWFPWLWAPPILAVLAVFTNEQHFLFWRRVELVASPFGVESVYDHGPLFWVATAYLYVLIVVATSLLVNAILLHRDIFRSQALVLLAAAAVPWFANALYLSGANPIPGFDWTPVAFAISGLLLAWAIFRVGLLELKPVACKVLFEQMGDPLLVLDLEQRIVDANPAAHAFLGVGRPLTGRLVTELLPATLIQALTTAAEDSTLTIAGDSGVHQFDVRSSPLMGANGVLDGCLLVLRDTTERMELEETLRQSEQRYRRLIDNAPFPALVSSKVDGAVLYANRRAHDLLMLAPVSDIPDCFADFFEERRAYTNLMTWITEYGAATDFEVQLQDTVGRHFCALISATPILYTEEEAILSSINDITVHKAAEQALIEAKVAAEAAARAKNDFLATMSHELRTPLSSMIGLAEALLDEGYGPLTERQKHSLSTIVQSGAQLTTLVSEVLDLSRLEAGVVTLNREMTLIDEVCRSVLYALQSSRPPPAPPFVYAITPPELQVEVDPRRLRDILLHLLCNAVKFTPPERHIGLTVTALPEQGLVQLIVWDEGIGIEPAAIEKLFRPFAQLDTGLARRYEGMGIGLAIVQHLVTLHGGSIRVESTPGQGSRFIVSLPA